MFGDGIQLAIPEGRCCENEDTTVRKKFYKTQQ